MTKNNKLAKPSDAWAESKALAIQNGEGLTDKKMAKILASKATKEEKQAQLVNYLFDQNNDSMAFFAEMFQFKGKSLKEVREFKSQVRFDFEMFVATFTTFLRDTSERVWGTMFNTKYDICDVIKEYNKSKSLVRYPWDPKEEAIALLAISFYDQAEHLEKVVKKITEQREKARGKGIYIDRLGITHSLYDEDIYDIIQKEKEEIMKKKKDVS